MLLLLGFDRKVLLVDLNLICGMLRGLNGDLFLNQFGIQVN